MLKKILAVLLVVTLTAAIAIGGTLAYLTDRDSEANVFTVGDVNIDLNEDFNQGATLVPGVNIEKKPTVTNTGINDAWVWATIAVPAALDNDDASKNVIHFNYSKDAEYNWTWTNEGQWLVEKNVEIEGVAYNVYTALYNEILQSGETTEYPVIYKVYMDDHIDIDPEGNWHHVLNGEVTDIHWNSETNGNPVIYVSAYAIQTEGFDSVGAAYAAYNTQWGDQGAEYGDPPEIFIVDGYKAGCEAGCIRYVAEGGSADVYKHNCDRIHRGVFSEGNTNLSQLIIHEGIRQLDDYALAKAPTVTSVTLPNSLEIIESNAFQKACLTELEIPENVTYMGWQSLGACMQLEKIVIKAKNITLANYLARNCPNLKEVYIYSDSVTFTEDGKARYYFTNTENGDASRITFYVSSQEVADALYNAATGSHWMGMLIKSLDGSHTYYNTLKQ